jgi:hypothetical protein
LAVFARVRWLIMSSIGLCPSRPVSRIRGRLVDVAVVGAGLA